MASAEGRPATDFVRLFSASKPDAIACADLDGKIELTYRQLDALADRRGSQLATCLGDGHGERVGVLSRNNSAMIALQWACVRQGAVFAPLNWRLAIPELTALVADLTPALLFYEEEFEATALAVADSCGATALSLSSQHELGDGGRTPLRSDEPSLLLYTSGTTGRPKGAICTEAGLTAACANYIALARVTSRSVLLCDAPMFHTIGLVAMCRSALQSGGSVLISTRFDPAVTYDRLINPELAITHYMAAPQMTQALRQVAGFDGRRLAHLTGIMTGGAPHPAAQIRTWAAEGVKLADGYGMSEAGTVTCVPPDLDVIEAKAGSVGVAGPTTELRIVGADGKDAPTGEAGEIWLSGPAVSPGYWNNPDATAAAREGAWLKTGDVAWRDDDGFVYVCDRLKDMYISGGENVYPAEVEAILLSLPGVSEASVIGAADPKWGEVGYAFVVGEADEESLRAACREMLAGYKQPKRFIRTSALPRTPSGKVQKHELRKRIEEEPA